MSAPFDRPTNEPGGCACDECGVVFVGAEGHSLCALCAARHQAAIAALQAVLKPLGTNLRHYEAYHRDSAILSMKEALGQGWQTIHNAPTDGTEFLGYGRAISDSGAYAPARHVVWWHEGAFHGRDPGVTYELTLFCHLPTSPHPSPTSGA